MPLIATAKGGPDHDPIPVGNHAAVCYGVADLGYEFSDTFQKWTRKCVLIWEIAETMPDGKPFAISKRYSLSLSDKANLLHDLVSWRGKAFSPQELAGFDLEKLVGANCLLNVISYTKRDGGEGRKVAGVGPLPKQMPRMTPVNKTLPEWVAKEKAKNDAAYAQAEGADAEPVVIIDEPPPQQGRPPQRLATQGNVPLSQPAKPIYKTPDVDMGVQDDSVPF